MLEECKNCEELNKIIEGLEQDIEDIEGEGSDFEYYVKTGEEKIEEILEETREKIEKVFEAIRERREPK